MLYAKVIYARKDEPSEDGARVTFVAGDKFDFDPGGVNSEYAEPTLTITRGSNIEVLRLLGDVWVMNESGKTVGQYTVPQKFTFIKQGEAVITEGTGSIPVFNSLVKEIEKENDVKVGDYVFEGKTYTKEGENSSHLLPFVSKINKIISERHIQGKILSVDIPLSIFSTFNKEKVLNLYQDLKEHYKINYPTFKMSLKDDFYFTVTW